MSVFSGRRRQAQSLWHIIAWMSTHEDYVTVGYVLAEYATKAALTMLLPPEKAREYANFLNSVGFDVKDAGLVSVGQAALGLVSTSPMAIAILVGDGS